MLFSLPTGQQKVYYLDYLQGPDAYRCTLEMKSPASSIPLTVRIIWLECLKSLLISTMYRTSIREHFGKSRSLSLSLYSYFLVAGLEIKSIHCLMKNISSQVFSQDSLLLLETQTSPRYELLDPPIPILIPRRTISEIDSVTYERH